MRKSVVRTVYMAGVFVLLTAGAIIWKHSFKHSEPDGEEENEEEEHRNGRLAGVDKQLATWFWSKGYPNPVGLNEKYERAWQQHLALQEYTWQIRQKALMGNRKNRATDEILMGNKLKGLTPIQESTSGNVSGNRGMGAWVSAGPKVFGGRILSIAINRVVNARNKRTLYAGSASGGIWRSYVGGEGADAWHPVNTNTPVLGVSSIVYHPSDTNILYAGTGEVYRVETLSSGTSTTNQTGNIGVNVWKARGTYGIGVLKTIDGGKTWSRVLTRNTNELFAIQKIVIDPANSNRVYACATDGLYRSNDAGANWTKIWTAIYVSDVAINPANNNQIVVAAGNLNNVSKGIWRTTDGFATTPVKLGTGAGLPASFKGFIKFDYNGTTLAAGIAGSSAGTEIYTATTSTSSNFGLSWTAKANSAYADWQYWFSQDIEFNPGDANQLVIAGVNIATYTLSSSTKSALIGNGSRTMNTNITPGASEGGTTYVHDDVHDVEYVPGSNNTFYVACDGGIFLTTNNGASFSTCNGGLQVHQFYGPTAQSATTSTFIGGLQDNDVIRFDGTGWSRRISGDGGPSVFLKGNESIVLGSNDARSVSQSTNGGLSFTNRLSNIGQTSPSNDARTGFMAPVASGPVGSTVFYVGSDNLHVSTNSGASFTNSTVSSMTKYIEAMYKTAIAIGVSNTDADKLYVSVSPIATVSDQDAVHYNPPANIWKITNGTRTTQAFAKTKVTSNLPDRFVMDFAIHPTNDEIVYAAVGGFGTDHVYVTKNGGTTWAPLGTGMLPDVPINTVLLDPNNPNIIYAGSDLGVYVSPDAGATWLDYGNGFWDATYVIDLVIAPGATPGSKKLRAVTHGKGIFDSPLLELSALPVTFNSFKGQKQEQHNLLQWTVSEESQLESYQVEKSTDGIAYKTVATVRARNLDGTQVYEYKDHQVGGSFYYRIKSVDLDGTYQYSSVVFLNRSNGEKMTLLVNPISTTIPLEFHVLRKGTVALRLVNNAGQVIRAAQASLPAGTSNYNLSDLQSLPQGVYYLEATFNRQRWVEKVVKN